MRQSTPGQPNKAEAESIGIVKELDAVSANLKKVREEMVSDEYALPEQCFQAGGQSEWLKNSRGETEPMCVLGSEVIGEA